LEGAHDEHSASGPTPPEHYRGAILVAGCGTSTRQPDKTVAPSATPPSTIAAKSAAPVGLTVTATENEFSIRLSRSRFAAGSYFFDVVNAGRYAHNLTIEGVGPLATPATAPGGQQELVITLQKGSYELWCSIDGHRGKGMDLRITVG